MSKHRLSLSPTADTASKRWKQAHAISERRRRASDLDAVADVIYDIRHSTPSLPPRLSTSSSFSSFSSSLFDDDDERFAYDDEETDSSFSRHRSEKRCRRRLSITDADASIIYGHHFIGPIVDSVDNNDDNVMKFGDAYGGEEVGSGNNNHSNDDDDNRGNVMKCASDRSDKKVDIKNSVVDVDADEFDADVGNDRKYSFHRYNIDNDNINYDIDKNAADSKIADASTTFASRLNQRVNQIKALNRSEYDRAMDVRKQETACPYIKKLSLNEIGNVACLFFFRSLTNISGDVPKIPKTIDPVDRNGRSRVQAYWESWEQFAASKVIRTSSSSLEINR